MQPLLSVIVPVYNVQPYLRRCLDSLLAQIYQALDIVLVDDGSTDGSGVICDIYAQRDARIRVVHQSNGGLVRAHKTGLLNAVKEAPFVTFVDSDDWLEPDAYYRDSHRIWCSSTRGAAGFAAALSSQAHSCDGYRYDILYRDATGVWLVVDALATLSVAVESCETGGVAA